MIFRVITAIVGLKRERRDICNTDSNQKTFQSVKHFQRKDICSFLLSILFSFHVNIKKVVRAVCPKVSKQATTFFFFTHQRQQQECDTIRARREPRNTRPKATNSLVITHLWSKSFFCHSFKTFPAQYAIFLLINHLGQIGQYEQILSSERYQGFWLSVTRGNQPCCNLTILPEIFPEIFQKKSKDFQNISLERYQGFWMLVTHGNHPCNLICLIGISKISNTGFLWCS